MLEDFIQPDMGQPKWAMILKSSEFTHVLRFQDFSIHFLNFFHLFESWLSLLFTSYFLLHYRVTTAKHIHKIEKRGKIDIHAIYQVLNSTSGFCLLFFGFFHLISLVSEFCVFALHLTAGGWETVILDCRPSSATD